MASQPMRIGTRGSPLALWQARHFASVARAAIPALAENGAIEEHIIATSGDKVQDKRLADIGGKGLFAKEIHEALADRRIDVAVHSLKDLETELPPGIVLAAVLEREDPRDALILGAECGAGTADDPLAALPQGALVGTASVRRQAQLLHRRPDLRVDIIRGNVQTRLGRVAAGDFTCSLLALAGLKRLGMADRAQVVLARKPCCPPPARGLSASPRARMMRPRWRFSRALNTRQAVWWRMPNALCSARWMGPAARRLGRMLRFCLMGGFACTGLLRAPMAVS